MSLDAGLTPGQLPSGTEVPSDLSQVTVLVRVAAAEQELLYPLQLPVLYAYEQPSYLACVWLVAGFDPADAHDASETVVPSDRRQVTVLVLFAFEEQLDDHAVQPVSVEGLHA